MVDPATSGRESDHEWVELQNTTAIALSLVGWSLEDNVEADTIPLVVIPAFGYVVIAGSSSVNAASPAVLDDGTIGNGLANAGDRLRLKDSAGRIVDEVSWGTAGGCRAPRRGRSLQRGSVPCGFEESASPSPGMPNTPTMIATPTAVAMTNRTYFPVVSKNGR